jgi:hypothetical protein
MFYTREAIGQDVEIAKGGFPSYHSRVTTTLSGWSDTHEYSPAVSAPSPFCHGHLDYGSDGCTVETLMNMRGLSGYQKKGRSLYQQKSKMKADAMITPPCSYRVFLASAIEQSSPSADV